MPSFLPLFIVTPQIIFPGILPIGHLFRGHLPVFVLLIPFWSVTPCKPVFFFFFFCHCATFRNIFWHPHSCSHSYILVLPPLASGIIPTPLPPSSTPSFLNSLFPPRIVTHAPQYTTPQTTKYKTYTMAFQQPSSALIVQPLLTVHKGRRGSPAFPIKNLRRYITLISQQLAIGASLIVKYPFKNPPVPTWPLHLTLFVAVIQATEAHQEHFAEDICDIRFWLDTFFHYLPKLPQMQIIPFKLPIPVHGRGLGGVLEPLEQAENGHRVLPGQWISDSRVWNRIMHMPIARSAQGSKDPYAAREGEKVILYYHGGGYFICSTATHRELLWRISKATGRRIFGKALASSSKNVFDQFIKLEKELRISDQDIFFSLFLMKMNSCGLQTCA